MESLSYMVWLFYVVIVVLNREFARYGLAVLGGNCSVN